MSSLFAGDGIYVEVYKRNRSVFSIPEAVFSHFLCFLWKKFRKFHSKKRDGNVENQKKIREKRKRKKLYSKRVFD
jgi:uncharacterized membrane protein